MCFEQINLICVFVCVSYRRWSELLCQKRRARSGRDRPDSRTCYVHQVTLPPVLLSSETGTAAYTTACCAVRYDTICYFNVQTKAERRVPELIPVLGSQLAGDVSHKPGGGCHYFPPGLQLPSQTLRGLLPVSLLGEQRHDGCQQFASRTVVLAIVFTV